MVCPEFAANIIAIVPMLNACPALSLDIEAAATGTHACIVRDIRTNDVIFRLNEDHGVLPLQLPLRVPGYRT